MWIENMLFVFKVSNVEMVAVMLEMCRKWVDCFENRLVALKMG